MIQTNVVQGRFRAGLCASLIGAAGLAMPMAPFLAPQTARAAATAATEEVATYLRNAIETGPADRRLENLEALRRLRDQRLRPLFGDIAGSETSDLRWFGIVAMSDLADDGLINVWLVAKLAQVREQRVVLARALAEGKMSVDQMGEVLTWPDLDPAVEVLLRGRMMKAGRQPDMQRLATLSENENKAVGVLADLLLLEAGQTEAGQRAAARLSSVGPELRDSTTAATLEHIRREGFEGAAGIVEEVLRNSDPRGPLHFDALATLVRIAPARGADEWLGAYSRASELGARLRLSMIVLENVSRADARVIDAIASDSHDLLKTIGAAAKAAHDAIPAAAAEDDHAGAPASDETEKKERSYDALLPALLRVVDAGHAPSTDWAIGVASGLRKGSGAGGSVADAVLLRVVHRALERADVRQPVGTTVFEAALLLAESHPALLEEPLRQARQKRDEAVCEAVLAALLRAAAGPVWIDQAVASNVAKWPSRRCEALAMLVQARAGVLDDAGATRVREIAMGWGSLPESFRVQAAWLSLCRDGEERTALTRILAPEPGE